MTSSLEFASALNLGFAISESFRSQTRKGFETSTRGWLASQAAESNAELLSDAEKRVDSDIEKSRIKGDELECKCVRRCRNVGVVAVGISVLLALLPLPIFVGNLSLLFWLYVVIWLCVIAALLNVAYTYWCLKEFWTAELDHVIRAAKVQTGKDVSAAISRGSR